MAVRPIVENSQTLRPETQARLQPADFSGGQTIGRAVQQLGGAVADFAQRQHDLQLSYAETAAKRARNQALLRAGEIRSVVTQSQLLNAEAARQEGERQ